MITLGLSTGELTYALAAVFVAGVVRGFTGFALSAMIMASLTLILPPVELLPVCVLLELLASAFLVRGGFGAADKKMVLQLQIGALIGTPLGLMLTTSMPPDASRLLAQSLIALLAVAQLLRLRLPVSGSTLATTATGIFSGFVTGVASIGGMVIALYTLARQLPPATVRGSLILVILIGGSLTFLWQVALGVMTSTGAIRAAALAIPMTAGVLLGRAFFTPKFEKYYRPVCLSLLIALAALGIARTMLSTAG